MHYKKWLWSGIIVFILSVLVGVVGTVGGIFGSFYALQTNDGTQPIDDVGAGIQNAFYSNIFSAIGIVIALILIAVGGVKFYRQRKSPS